MPSKTPSLLSAKTFWGKVLEGTAVAGALIATTPIALVKGAVDAANGKSFGKGFGETFDKLDELVPNATFEKIGEFGDKNGAVITTVVVGTVTSLVVKDAHDTVRHGVERHHASTHHPPQIPPPKV